MDANIIRVNNLVKKYKIYNKPVDRLKEAISPFKKIYSKEYTVLNDISFEVKKGDAIGILGKNGSGKSTLLKIITGVLTQTAGTIDIKGRISSILELGTGFNVEYSGIQNIYLNGTIMGYSEKEMKQKADKIIEFADIGDFIEQPVKIYSSGMFARLAFAVAINVDPDILIIDEVLAVGDIKFQMKCIDKLKELKDQGTTILFVSHATEQVKRFCNRAIWLKDGQIETVGEASKVVDMYEDFMKFGTGRQIEPEKEKSKEEEALVLPEDKNIVASITKVKINKSEFQTFDELCVEVMYEIYEDSIEDFLLGVAVYSADRKGYIFGPNSYLDNVEVPNKKGRHKVIYSIPSLTLIKGSYVIDAGIFNNKGIVMLDYKESVHSFFVSNNYFTEGDFYMDHQWSVIN
ncbi:MAG: ABC transporter ATP-binding protein [Lachnospiraceae bacterium]|nr:ABC transporter ATP-binding protein [Lachnospiraceae bacterium]